MNLVSARQCVDLELVTSLKSFAHVCIAQRMIVFALGTLRLIVYAPRLTVGSQPTSVHEWEYW